jgi:Fur family ferric uptake transcriptional regulator
MPYKKIDPIKKDDIQELVKQKFTEYLIEHEQRKTPERYAILEKIYSIKGHFDLETLSELMKKDFRVSRATIYNTLELLIDCNLIIKHHFSTEIIQYEKAYNNIHHHLICTHCHSIKEFTDESIKKTIRSKPLGGFTVANFTIYAYGLCAKCSKALKNKDVNKRQ